MEITLDASLIGHHHPIYCLSNSVKNGIFFSGGVDEGLVKWSSPKKSFLKVLFPVDASIYSIINLPNPNVLLCGLQNAKINYFNFTTAESGTLKTQMDGPVYDIQFSSTKNIFYAVSGNGSLSAYDVNSLDLIQTKRICEDGIRCLQIIEADNKIILGCRDHKIRMLDLNSFEELMVLEGHTLPVFSMAYDQRFPYFISGSRDAQIKVWDIKSYQLIENIPAHMFAVNKLLFHPKESIFISASMDKSIKIWNAETFKLMKIIDRSRFDSHRLSINSICFSEEDKLVSVSDDKLVKIWDLKF